jgi:DNA-binding response OmpR family regulator
MLLELEGHHIVEAEDGFSLPTDLQTNDLVILDVMMPGKDGMNVLEDLQRLPGGGPRVLMLTAKTGEGDRQRALQRGAVSFVTKPFEPDDVVAEVKRALSEPEDKLRARREHEVYLSRLLQQLDAAADRHRTGR